MLIDFFLSSILSLGAIVFSFLSLLVFFRFNFVDVIVDLLAPRHSKLILTEFFSSAV